MVTARLLKHPSVKDRVGRVRRPGAAPLSLIVCNLHAQQQYSDYMEVSDTSDYDNLPPIV